MINILHFEGRHTLVSFTIDFVQGGPTLPHMRAILTDQDAIIESMRTTDFPIATGLPFSTKSTDRVAHLSSSNLSLLLTAYKAVIAVNVYLVLLGVWGLVVFWAVTVRGKKCRERAYSSWREKVFPTAETLQVVVLSAFFQFILSNLMQFLAPGENMIIPYAVFVGCCGTAFSLVTSSLIRGKSLSLKNALSAGEIDRDAPDFMSESDVDRDYRFVYEPEGVGLRVLGKNDWEQNHMRLEKLFDLSDEVFDEVVPEQDPSLMAAFLNSNLLQLGQQMLGGGPTKSKEELQMEQDRKVRSVEVPTPIRNVLRDAMVQFKLRHAAHPVEAEAIDWMLGQLDPTGFDLLAVKVPAQAKHLIAEAIYQHLQRHSMLQLDACYKARMQSTLQQLAPISFGDMPVELPAGKDGGTDDIRRLVSAAIKARITNVGTDKEKPRDMTQEEGVLLQMMLDGVGEEYPLMAMPYQPDKTLEFYENRLKAEIGERREEIDAASSEYVYDHEVFCDIPVITRDKAPDLIETITGQGDRRQRRRKAAQSHLSSQVVKPARGPPPLRKTNSASANADGQLTFVISDEVLGIAMRDEVGGAVVSKVKADSQAASLGVPIGGKVVSINGTEAATTKEEITAQLKSASRPTTLLVAPVSAPPASSGADQPAADLAPIQEDAEPAPLQEADQLQAVDHLKEVAFQEADQLQAVDHVKEVAFQEAEATGGDEPEPDLERGAALKALAAGSSKHLVADTVMDVGFGDEDGTGGDHLLDDLADGITIQADVESGLAPTPPASPPDFNGPSRLSSAGSMKNLEKNRASAKDLLAAPPTAPPTGAAVKRRFWRRRRRADHEKMSWSKQFTVIIVGSAAMGFMFMVVNVLVVLIPPLVQFFALYTWVGAVPISIILHHLLGKFTIWLRKRIALRQGRNVEGLLSRENALRKPGQGESSISLEAKLNRKHSAIALDNLSMWTQAGELEKMEKGAREFAASTDDAEDERRKMFDLKTKGAGVMGASSGGLLKRSASQSLLDRKTPLAQGGRASVKGGTGAKTTRSASLGGQSPRRAGGKKESATAKRDAQAHPVGDRVRSRSLPGSEKAGDLTGRVEGFQAPDWLVDDEVGAPATATEKQVGTASEAAPAEDDGIQRL